MSSTDCLDGSRQDRYWRKVRVMMGMMKGRRSDGGGPGVDKQARAAACDSSSVASAGLGEASGYQKY